MLDAVRQRDRRLWLATDCSSRYEATWLRILAARRMRSAVRSPPKAKRIDALEHQSLSGFENSLAVSCTSISEKPLSLKGSIRNADKMRQSNDQILTGQRPCEFRRIPDSVKIGPRPRQPYDWTLGFVTMPSRRRLPRSHRCDKEVHQTRMNPITTGTTLVHAEFEVQDPYPGRSETDSAKNHLPVLKVAKGPCSTSARTTSADF